VFPAAYAPSTLVTDPFVVEPCAWLRKPRGGAWVCGGAAEEALEDVMGGLRAMAMDVDEDVGVVGVVCGAAGAKGKGMRSAVTGRLERPLPRRRAVQLRQDSCGTASSGAGSGSSGVSRSPCSRSPSSTLSSPHLSDASPLTPLDGGAADEGAGAAWSPALAPVPACKVRVDAWVTELPALEPGSKWEQLLAAACVAPPVRPQDGL